MKNTTTTLYINGERTTAYTSPAKCRAALDRYNAAPPCRLVCDCYRAPSLEKNHAERDIIERIRRNTVCGADYTVISFNNFNFTAGYFLDGIDPDSRDFRRVLCIETARYQYHYDVTGLL